MRIASALIICTLGLFLSALSYSSNSSSLNTPTASFLKDAANADLLAKPAEANSYCYVDIRCPERAIGCEATGDITSCSKGRNWIKCWGQRHNGTEYAEVTYVCKR